MAAVETAKAPFRARHPNIVETAKALGIGALGGLGFVLALLISLGQTLPDKKTVDALAKADAEIHRLNQP